MALFRGAKKQKPNLSHSLSRVYDKKYRRIFLAIFLVWIVVVSVQITYPQDKGLPLASVNGRSVRLEMHNVMAKIVTDEFAVTKVILAVGNDKKVTFTLTQMGAEPNTEDMVAKLSHYPLWQRFIPGSILWQPAQVTTADVYYDSSQLDHFADTASGQLTFPPSNARLTIQNGTLNAISDVVGSTVTKDDVKYAVTSGSIQLGRATTIQVPSKRTPPERVAKDLDKVRTQAEAIIGRDIAITANGTTFMPTKNDIAAWVILSTDAHGNVALSIDQNKVADYLATINDKVGTPAGQTDIDIVNGNETGRTIGAPGSAVNSDALKQQIAAQLMQSSAPIVLTAQMVPVAPGIIYNHTYTSSQAGLQAYVNDMAATRNMHIVVQQLSGQKWYAAARETESIPSASTYKLFLSLVLFDRINKGEIHWDDPMLDTDVEGCFDRMTIPSTNPCAEAWIAQFGRQYINDFIHALGFSDGTNFVVTDAVHTTATDLTKFMIGLNDGTLVGGDNRDRLLHNLSIQPYKYGIPTGSSVPANQIYDKVGFLWDYVHDTAIVPHPQGTYILTIMSEGQGYAGVAEVAKQIERIMYP